MMGGAEGPVLEGYAALAFLAAHTSRAKLLALATPASYRHPGLLAKTVTALDVVSGGRAWLGIGAGDYEAETRGLGIPYPPLAERYELLEDAVRVCRRMWSGEQGDERPFAGIPARLERPLNLPHCLSRPHPPILIGGSGERRRLPLVARYGDACNLRPSPEIPRQLELLRGSCEAEGRDSDAIEKTAVFRFDVGEDGARGGELIGRLRWLAGMGIQTVFGRLVGDHRLAPIEAIGRAVMPAGANL